MKVQYETTVGGRTVRVDLETEGAGECIAAAISTSVSAEGEEAEFANAVPTTQPWKVVTRAVLEISAVPVTGDEERRSVESAMSYERASRRVESIRNRRSYRGRPRNTARLDGGRVRSGFTKAEGFAVLVLYFESLGHRQAVKAVYQYWRSSKDWRCEDPPTPRQVKEAIRAVRGWYIVDLPTQAEHTRVRFKLDPLPRTKLHRHTRRREPSVN